MGLPAVPRRSPPDHSGEPGDLRRHSAADVVRAARRCSGGRRSTDSRSSAIRHGWLWQFVTYAFMYVDPTAASFCRCWEFTFWAGRSRRELAPRVSTACFSEASFSRAVLDGVALAFTRDCPGAAMGSGAAANAILMVFYLFNRGAPIMLFPIPIQIPVKWIVLFTAAIEMAYLLLSHFALFYFILLLGLGAGYVWYSLFLTRKTIARPLRKIFQPAQFLLPLEAPPRRPQIRGVHARPRPHRHLRRARKLHPSRGLRQEGRRREVGLGELEAALSSQLSARQLTQTQSIVIPNSPEGRERDLTMASQLHGKYIRSPSTLALPKHWADPPDRRGQADRCKAPPRLWRVRDDNALGVVYLMAK